MATKNNETTAVRTHAADTVFSTDEKGFGTGYSICGIYSFVLVKDHTVVTCKNCQKRLERKS